jgi:hypothetical protein
MTADYARLSGLLLKNAAGSGSLLGPQSPKGGHKIPVAMPTRTKPLVRRTLRVQYFRDHGLQPSPESPFASYRYLFIILSIAVENRSNSHSLTAPPQTPVAPFKSLYQKRPPKRVRTHAIARGRSRYSTRTSRTDLNSMSAPAIRLQLNPVTQ